MVKNRTKRPSESSPNAFRTDVVDNQRALTSPNVDHTPNAFRTDVVDNKSALGKRPQEDLSKGHRRPIKTTVQNNHARRQG